MKTRRPRGLVLADELERLVVDDRLDDLLEGLAHDASGCGPGPSPWSTRSADSRMRGHPGLVGAEVEVDELAVEGPQQQPAGEQAGPVEGLAEGHHRGAGDDGLVEVEEGGLHAAHPRNARTPVVRERSSRLTWASSRVRPAVCRARPGASPACHLCSGGRPVLLSCWSAQGRRAAPPWSPPPSASSSPAPRHDVLLVDLAGDVPAALGLPEPDGPGLTDWLAAGADVPADGLGRLEVPPAPAWPCCPGVAASLGRRPGRGARRPLLDAAPAGGRRLRRPRRRRARPGGRRGPAHPLAARHPGLLPRPAPGGRPAPAAVGGGPGRPSRAGARTGTTSRRSRRPGPGRGRRRPRGRPGGRRRAAGQPPAPGLERAPAPCRLRASRARGRGSTGASWASVAGRRRRPGGRGGAGRRPGGPAARPAPSGAGWPTGWSARIRGPRRRSSRCWPIPRSPRSWSTARARSGSSGRGACSATAIVLDRRRPSSTWSSGSWPRSACGSTGPRPWSTPGCPTAPG